MARLTGKRALVTGGGRGIGAAIVRRLVNDGASVALNYRSDSQGAQALADSLDNDETTVVALQADVTDPVAIRDLVDRTVTALGGLDILVSNAGVEHFGAFEDVSVADYDPVFDTNARAQLFTAQAAAAAISPGGRIVLMSSVSARIAVYHHGLYAASKAAASALVLNLAPELAERGIAINALAPGGTDTGMAAEHARTTSTPLFATCRRPVVQTQQRVGPTRRARRNRSRSRVPRLTRRLIHHWLDTRRGRRTLLTHAGRHRHAGLPPSGLGRLDHRDDEPSARNATAPDESEDR